MHDSSIVRKRLPRVAPEGKVLPAGRRGDTVAMGLFFLICIFSLFSPGAPVQLSHGVLFVLSGMLIMALPPRVMLPRSWYFIAAVFLIFSSLCFLPSAWGGSQPLRKELDTLGLDSGPLVTAHPRQSFEQLCGLTITVMVGLTVLSRRVSGRSAQRLALLFPLGVAAYAVISILAVAYDWNLAWDQETGFGFFPNRNHTATLLAMGTVTGGAVMFQSVKGRHGGSAGLAAIALIFCLWALGGYNLSRAGLLLVGGGLLAWVAFLGRDWISGRALIIMVVIAGAVGVLFWLADTGLKSRILAPDPTVKSVHNGVDDIPRTATTEGEAIDFRLLVYRDTWSLISSAPWSGSGPGMFRYVFPHYRWYSSTSNNSQSVHPESDWLMVAAESGLPAMFVLAGGVGLAFIAALKSARSKSTWPIRLGCLVAAAIVPLHGLIDVPGHRIGLTWSAVFLLALVMRDFDCPPAAASVRAVWRVAGLAILLVGGSLLRAEWWGGSPLAEVKAAQLAAAARELLALDQEEQHKLATEDQPTNDSPGDPAGEDRLETALTLVDEALEITPLDPELHFLRGSLALFFADKEAITNRAYAIQRQLDPTWVRLPLRQARNWSGIDSKKTSSLWSDAIGRAARLESIARDTFMNRRQVFSEIMDQAEKSAHLSTLAADHIGEDTGRLTIWMKRAHTEALNAGAPALLEHIKAPSLGPLHEIWMARDPAAAGQWIAQQPVQ